jgi:hypothetical protein
VGIDILWRDSDGEQRDLVADVSSAISTAIQRVREDARRRHLLISSIDPYGDTRFSSGQAPQLLREFQALRSESSDPEERVAIGRVISVLRAVEGTVDEWLEFLGD